ncbi:MAG TPA: GntR family transcriptional regulator [Trebonia sp.]
MLIRIDPADPRPLYQQIELQVRSAIGDGSLTPGGRLPPARELAEDIGVNVHTVLRAYGALRDAGLLELRPRRGAVVTSAAPPRQQLAALAKGLIEQAREHGLSAAEIVDLVAGEL